MPAPLLGKCANPECKAEFKRLGTGKIYTLPVSQPQAWGLPAHIKQKVVWLCANCAAANRVEFDEERFEVRVVSRQQLRRQSA